MESLSAFDLEVLENLPVEPTGLSLAELADGLLSARSPAAKGKVRRALENICRVLGRLYVYTSNDDLDGFGVKMYGVPRVRMPRVRAFLGGIGALPLNLPTHRVDAILRGNYAGTAWMRPS
jgi:hypothetical protein